MSQAAKHWHYIFLSDWLNHLIARLSINTKQEGNQVQTNWLGSLCRPYQQAQLPTNNAIKTRSLLEHHIIYSLTMKQSRSAHSRSSNESSRSEIPSTDEIPFKNDITNGNTLRCDSQRTRFEDLPFDICCEIVRYLNVESALSLVSTNRYLHQNLSSKFLFLISRLDETDFLQRAKGFAKYRKMQMWACFKCLLMLPRSSFQRRILPKETGDASRECLDCREQRWRKSWGDWKMTSTQCVDQRKPPSLERLPVNILRGISHRLKYLDVINLRSTCCLMRLNVSADWVPLHERFLAVRGYEPIILHDGTISPARYPCYGCFK